MTDKLKQIIRQNFVAHNTYAAQYNHNIKTALTSHYFRTDCGLNTDTFNVSIPLTDTPSDALYSEMTEYFTRQNKPMSLWLWDDLSSWHRYLDNSPLPHTEVNLGMYAMAEMLQTRDILPEDFAVKTVQTVDDVLCFSTVMSSVFGQSAEAENVRSYYAALSQTGFFKADNIRYFIGLKAGRPVSCGSVTVNSDSVGIYDIATLETERNRGFGSAIFHYILRFAAQYPGRLCVLQASPDGAGIYQRAGLKAVCDVFVYENRDLLAPV